MGTVYAGKDLHDQRDVAVKVLELRVDHALDPEYRERFAREARLSTRLSHRNIVDVFDAGESEDVAYLVMELLQGRTLAQRLSDERVLPWRQAVFLFRQMCDGLAFAHDMGLIHRDLKPANCFLVGSGEETHVKLLDFGLAKHAQPVHEDDDTRSTVVMGSPAFMAPEQARGEASPKSDIYSLGVMLFRMLTGEMPFKGRTAIDVIVEHIQGPVPWFEEVGGAPPVPIEVELVVRRCLEKDPRARYATVPLLIEAVDEALRQAIQSPGGRRATPAPPPRRATSPEVRSASDGVEAPAPAPAPQARPLEVGPLFASLQPRPTSRLPFFVGGAALLAAVLAFVFWPRPAEPVAQPPAPPVAEPTHEVPQPSPAKAAEPSAPGVVQFRINSIPTGATVRIGRKTMGVTPVTFDVDADGAGEATAELTIELKGYQSITFVATSPGPRFDLVQRLTKGRGQVVIARSSTEDESEGATAEATGGDSTAASSPPQPAPLTEQPGAPVDLVAMATPLPTPEPAPLENGLVPPERLSVRPRLISAEAPRYTSQARVAKVSGVVVVRCVVSAEGQLQSCHVVKSVPLMDESVLESMQAWRYEPGRLNGKAVASEITIPVRVSP